MLEKIVVEKELTVTDVITRHSDSREISREESIATTTPDLPNTRRRSIKAKTRRKIRNSNDKKKDHYTKPGRLRDKYKVRMITGEKFDYGNTSLDTSDDTYTTASQSTHESTKNNTDINLLQYDKEPDTFQNTSSRDGDPMIRVNKHRVGKQVLGPGEMELSVNPSTGMSATSSVPLNSFRQGNEVEVLLDEAKQIISKGSEITMKFDTNEKLINATPSFIMRESSGHIIDSDPSERTRSVNKETTASVNKETTARKYLARKNQRVDLTGMAVKIHQDESERKAKALYDMLHKIVSSDLTESDQSASVATEIDDELVIS